MKIKYVKGGERICKSFHFLLIFFSVVILWLSGVFWSLFWIDGQTGEGFPGKLQVSIARLFWSSAPAFDRNTDLDRALKLSRLAIIAEINNKKIEKNVNIPDILYNECLFLRNYLIVNAKSMSFDKLFQATVQLLTYFNRIELYRHISLPELEANFKKPEKKYRLRH